MAKFDRGRPSSSAAAAAAAAAAIFVAALLGAPSAGAATDAGDVGVLEDIRNSLDNPQLLKWPGASASSDPCGDRWNGVYCNAAGRVAQLQFQNVGLSGPLPPSFPRLTALYNLGLQNNKLRGALPSFAGLSSLQYAFLNGNAFDSIPGDFFNGLGSLQVLALDENPLNVSSGGWALPEALTNSPLLVNLTLSSCGLVGEIPAFLGGLGNLQTLQMSYNNLSGPIPPAFAGSLLQTLWLNNQGGAMLSGSLDVIVSMTALQDLWLHGNAFSGTIPDGVGNCKNLWRFWANENSLVGLIPANLTSLPMMKSLQLDGNMLMGPIPKVPYNFTFSGNAFCSQTPGVACAPQVTALLGFLGGVQFPVNLVTSWSGDDPCGSTWRGVSCSGGNVTILNLPDQGLSGTISSALGELAALTEIKLGSNNLTGQIPASLTRLTNLELLDLSGNDLSPPLPKFASSVRVMLSGNQLFNKDAPSSSPVPPGSPSPVPPGSPSPVPPGSPSPLPVGGSPPSTEPGGSPSTPVAHPMNGSLPLGGGSNTKSNFDVIAVAISVPIGVLFLVLVGAFFASRMRTPKPARPPPNAVVVYPRDSSDPDKLIKIVVAGGNAPNRAADSGSIGSGGSSGDTGMHVFTSAEFVVGVQVLRKATSNFSQDNILGRGGFGVVYKGLMEDGTEVAVKRMEVAVLSNKALNEFKAEIAVLSKVRHRNLVSILGYSVEGSERLLVYEYMPQGALSRHLFQWRQLNLEPLKWKRRLSIALDVARGMEYLHTLARSCFIHRDLKSANILLADGFLAKVSDFGLAKLAPEGEYSVTTRLAGTFGYLAPEYAVTGRVTTKADVFSFGVVLMELITGMAALDETRPEEMQYLASWFCRIRFDKDKLRAAVDPSLNIDDETFRSISIVSELAGHCTARDPYQRPDMSHAVNVLSALVGTWKPASGEQEQGATGVQDRTQEEMGIDVGQPLLQMVKAWQAAELSGSAESMSSISDSKGSIPARPAGLAESFTSADGR